MTWQVSETVVEKLNSELWLLYGAWDISRESQMVGGRSTWPMSFEGESAHCRGPGGGLKRDIGLCAGISNLMQSALGWSESEVAEMRALMFDKSDAWGREGFEAEQVTWSDVMHTFRTAWSRSKGLVVAEGWSEDDDALFTVMTKKNRLQYRIEKQSIRQRLLGSWRVYCVPGDKNPLAALYRKGSFDVMFKKADKSANGYLDHAELAAVLEWHGFQFSVNTVDEVMALTDGDKDGHMDYWEFVELMTKYCKVEEATAIDPPFSYGLVISEVDEETLTFKGRSRKPGRYEVGDGKVEYVNI